MENFDLTTKSGLEKASDFIGKYIEYTPYGLACKVAKWIFDSDSVKKQNEVIKNLIEKGKSQGVDEMDIKISNKKGFRLNIPLEEGINVDSHLGSDETITIHVSYK